MAKLGTYHMQALYQYFSYTNPFMKVGVLLASIHADEEPGA